MAGSGTLVVASATGLPATGTFRLRLGNLAGTILRVDSRVGATCTVTVEQDDGNANVGDSVTLVVTAGGLLQLKADAIAGGGGGGWPWWPSVVALDQSAWAWVNQGGSVVSQANGIVELLIPSATTNIRARVVAAPAAPYVITALVAARIRAIANTQFAGLCFRESGTGKLITWAFYGGQLLQATKYTNPTTFSAVLGAAAAMKGVGVMPIWLRIADDNTTLRCSASIDGRNFFEYASEGRTVFMAGAPNEIGICANVDGSAGEMAADTFSWVQT